MKKICRSLVVLACIFLLSCKQEAEPAAEEHVIEEERIQIGIMFDTFVVERWKRDRDVFVSEAKNLGADVIVQNAHGDSQVQLEQFYYLLNKKVDAIVVVPVDADSLAGPIKSAKEQGIKIISYDRLASEANVDLYISFDNERIGALTGENLAKILQKGDGVLMVSGPITDNNVALVNKGFVQEMEKNEIKVVETILLNSWNSEEAYDAIGENAGILYGIQAVMCGNDYVAGGVIKALSERRFAGDIYVTGQDADLEACQRIVEGTQAITIYKPIEQLARQAAYETVALIKQEASVYKDSIFDGAYWVPYIKLEPIAVTEENIRDIIIDSGFHLEEDVYINRPGLIIKKEA